MRQLAAQAVSIFVGAIEAHHRPGRQARYIGVCLLMLAGLYLSRTSWFSGVGRGALPRALLDFDVFYTVGQMVWRGEVGKAYFFEHMGGVQEAMAGAPTFMPWTYPPQFNLVMAPLALLPRGLAYALFAASSLAYLWILRRLAGAHFASILVLLFPSFGITLACGQNGFLLGALVGLVCLSFSRNPVGAGASLGLMVIKPHLALGLGALALVSRRWHVVGAAALVVGLSSLLAVAALGSDIVPSFVNGVREAGVFLEHGFYPLHRMVSLYATLRSAGAPAALAFAAHAGLALFALGLVCLAALRGAPIRQSLGLAAIASLQFSPYAYDYDLPVLGVGLALVFPDLVACATKRERAAIYGLIIFIGLFGLAQILRMTASSGLGDHSLLSLGGPGLLLVLIIVWKVLRRPCADATAPAQFPVSEASCG